LYSLNHEGVETTAVAAAALPFLAVHGGGDVGGCQMGV